MNHKQFILAGRATFTATSRATGQRFTYRVTAPTITTDAGGKKLDHDATVRFVSVLTGSDNDSDYQFMGMIFEGERYIRGKKSRIGDDAMSNKAFKYVWQSVMKNDLGQLDIHHAGQCGRCGRRLTVPESIDSGFGPECIGKVA